jgi:hypothetical protein
MFTRLFNRDDVEVYQLMEQKFEDIYHHNFGGDACHDGVIPPDCQKPVHLFYNLDVSDPFVGVEFANSTITRLPLYYALGNLGGPFRYRVVSDTRIEILCQPYPEEFRIGIMKEYLEPFPLENVELIPLDYDPKDPAHVWDLGGILGIDDLSGQQQSTLRKKLERWHEKHIGGPLVEKDDEDEPDPTLTEIIENCTPFTQGMPKEKCPHPKCEMHRAGKPLLPLLLLAPDEGDAFYECIAGGNSGQLIWQVCRSCASVVVTNQSS